MQKLHSPAASKFARVAKTNLKFFNSNPFLIKLTHRPKPQIASSQDPILPQCPYHPSQVPQPLLLVLLSSQLGNLTTIIPMFCLPHKYTSPHLLLCAQHYSPHAPLPLCNWKQGGLGRGSTGETQGSKWEGQLGPGASSCFSDERKNSCTVQTLHSTSFG